MTVHRIVNNIDNFFIRHFLLSKIQLEKKINFKQKLKQKMRLQKNAYFFDIYKQINIFSLIIHMHEKFIFLFYFFIHMFFYHYDYAKKFYFHKFTYIFKDMQKMNKLIILVKNFFTFISKK